MCVAYGKNHVSDSKERGPVFNMAVFGLWDYSQPSFHYLHFSASSSCYTGTCIAVAIKKKIVFAQTVDLKENESELVHQL